MVSGMLELSSHNNWQLNNKTMNDYKSLVYLYVIDVLSLGVMLPYLRPRKN